MTKVFTLPRRGRLLVDLKDLILLFYAEGAPEIAKELESIRQQLTDQLT